MMRECGLATMVVIVAVMIALVVGTVVAEDAAEPVRFSPSGYVFVFVCGDGLWTRRRRESSMFWCRLLEVYSGRKPDVGCVTSLISADTVDVVSL